MMFAQANSEHCRHKIFNASWTIDGRDEERSLFKMIKNTYELGGEGVLSAYADNASVVAGPKAGRFYPDPETGQYGYSHEHIHLLMKVETHNHPTAIAPFPGAGTGSGGEIRDEGAVGKGSKPKVGLTGFTVSNLRIPGYEQPWEHDYGKPNRIEMERRCQEVIDQCWSRGEDNPIAFIHDVGAGGLSNAFPELAKDGGCGAVFELRNVPNDEPGMSPLEIWCNESQERYVMAIPPSKIEEFESICKRERCPYAIVGDATDEQTLTLNDRHFDAKPIDLPMDILFGKAPKMHRIASKHYDSANAFSYDKIPLGDAVERVIQHPAVASKMFLISIGDRSVTGMVARDQLVGPWQVPVADCAITTVSYDSYAGEAMSMGERTPLALLDQSCGKQTTASSI